MKPGPDIIYKCPKCGVFLKRGSLMSGNTFGAQLYSDGKRISPMLPDFPNLTKCKKCDSIFWISELDKIGELRWGETSHPEWENADEVDFLCLKDLFRALKTAKNQGEEKLIRIWIWQAFNDRVRTDGNLFLESKGNILWKENCHALLKLLHRDEVNDKLMMAELYRNLKEFEKCIEILDSIVEIDLNWIKDRMKRHAERKISAVFLLND
jgi:hypothetical protein